MIQYMSDEAPPQAPDSKSAIPDQLALPRGIFHDIVSGAGEKHRQQHGGDVDTCEQQRDRRGHDRRNRDRNRLYVMKAHNIYI